MKGYRFKKLIWILILLKFLDIITTIIAVGYLGAKEINPLGYNIVLIISTLYLPLFFMIAKYYHLHNGMRIGLQMKKGYTIVIATLQSVIAIYVFVVINNITQLLHYAIL